MLEKPDSFEPKPYLLKNKIQHYAWGTVGKNAFIPKFINEKIEPNTPYAELWIGAHPSAPSEVEIDDVNIPLNKLIEQYPKQILGAEVAVKFDNKLPFLFKVLSAAEALSIQAHPNKVQAVELHQKDPTHYPDDNHKPEIAIALDSLIALVGFKPAEEIKKVLRNYPEISNYLGNDCVAMLNSANESNLPAHVNIIKQVYTIMMKKSLTHEPELAKALHSLEQRLIVSNKKLTEAEKFFLELKKKYGTDVGLFSLFLLNMIHLKPGEGIFLSAGIPHAYLKGNIVECMANSDNVVRAGLTPKFKDVKTLLQILRFDFSGVPILKPDNRKSEFTYQTSVPEFRVTRCNYDQNMIVITDNHSPKVYLIVSGEVAVEWKNGSENHYRSFHQGQTFLIPATLSSYKIVTSS